MPRAKTAEEVIDTYLSTATQAKLERLQSDLRAVLRWKFNVGAESAPTKRARKPKDSAKLPLAAIGEGNG